MTTREIGKFITQRRELLRLRQEDLAEMSAIAIKTIHLVESGLGNPSLKTIEKIAGVLGLEVLLEVKKGR